MNRYIKAISYATVIVALFSMTAFWVTLIWPYQPVVLLQPIRVINPKVQPGQVVKIYMQFDKRMDIAPEVNYFLVDTFIYRIDSFGVRRPVGQNSVVTEKKLPDSTPPGKYKIQIELSYRVFPWRTINYVWTSNEFEVVK